MAKKVKPKDRLSFRQLFVQLLEKELDPSLLKEFDGEKIAAFVGGDTITPSHVMAVVMLQKAMKGDAKAFEFIRDTIGEKPKDKQEIVRTDYPKIQIKRMEQSGK